jgi:hypothetical protein
LAIIALAACSGEKRKVENLVTVYNEVLVDAYLRPDPTLMQNFTTAREYIRIDNYIAYLLKENRVLRADLKETAFVAVRVKEEDAEAVTRERWVYVYLDARTRRPLTPEYDAVYSNTDYLAKQEGRWVVERVESEELVGESRASEMKEAGGRGGIENLPGGAGHGR